MTTDGRRRFIINFSYFAIVLLMAYFVFKFAIGFLMPFIAAYLIAAMLRPLAAAVFKKTHLPYKYSSLLVIALFYCTMGALVFTICSEIVEFISGWITELPSFYTSTVEPMLKALLARIMGVPDDPDQSLLSMINGFSDVLSSVGTILSSFSTWALERVSAAAMSMPAIVVKALFTVIASFYFVADHELLSRFIQKQFSEEARGRLCAVRSAVRDIVVSYVRSYAIIMGVTFAELTVSFMILRVPGAVMLAALIAAFDILPVVGTGTILWPWIAVEAFVNENYGLAVGLAVSYVVIFIVRNVIEPKIVGHGVGLHPLVTLISMFVGTALFGFVGLFGVPITVALIVDLNDKGIINVFEK